MRTKGPEKIKVSVYLMPEQYKKIAALSEYSGINRATLTAMSAQAGLGALDRILRGENYKDLIKEEKSVKKKQHAVSTGGG
jgi:hypothetical protein